MPCLAYLQLLQINEFLDSGSVGDLGTLCMYINIDIWACSRFHMLTLLQCKILTIVQPSLSK